MREVAENYLAGQRELAENAVEQVVSITHRGRRPDQWRDAVARIGPRLLELQLAAAAAADGYVDDVLQAQNASAAADAVVVPQAWTDFTDGGGSWLANLVYAVNSLPRAGIDSDLLGRRITDLAASIVLAGIQDTGRSAVQAAMLARPAVTAYVRMLNPPSCSRCAILAGRRYRSRSPFRRHPRCDCRSIPAAEDAQDWATDPRDYFTSLSTPEQDRVFGTAGAAAIRDGADMAQVVNADKGVTTVTAYGRELRITTEGTTRRGLYGGYEVAADGTLTVRTTAAPPRLMPDEIYFLAEEFGWDRAETLRQLRRFAYVL